MSKLVSAPGTLTPFTPTSTFDTPNCTYFRQYTGGQQLRPTPIFKTWYLNVSVKDHSHSGEKGPLPRMLLCFLFHIPHEIRLPHLRQPGVFKKEIVPPIDKVIDRLFNRPSTGLLVCTLASALRIFEISMITIRKDYYAFTF